MSQGKNKSMKYPRSQQQSLRNKLQTEYDCILLVAENESMLQLGQSPFKIHNRTTGGVSPVAKSLFAF